MNEFWIITASPADFDQAKRAYNLIDTGKLLLIDEDPSNCEERILKEMKARPRLVCKVRVITNPSGVKAKGRPLTRGIVRSGTLLKDMPCDCLAMVMYFMDSVKDLTAIRLTCKSLNECIENPLNAHGHVNIRFRILDGFLNETTMSRLTKRLPLVKTLGYVSNLAMSGEFRLISSLHEHFPNVRILVSQHMRFQQGDMCGSLQPFRHLRTLVFSHSIVVNTSEPVFVLDFSTLKNLGRLQIPEITRQSTLTYNDLRAEIHLPRSLRHLELHTKAVECVANWPDLEELVLKLGNDVNTYNVPLDSLPKSLSKLTVAAMRAEIGSAHTTNIENLRKFTNLTTLALRDAYITGVSGTLFDGIHNVSLRNSGLTADRIGDNSISDDVMILDMRTFQFTTDEFELDISEFQFPRYLRVLDLSDVIDARKSAILVQSQFKVPETVRVLILSHNKLTNHNLMHFKTSNFWPPKLDELHLYGNNKITIEGFKYLPNGIRFLDLRGTSVEVPATILFPKVEILKINTSFLGLWLFEWIKLQEGLVMLEITTNDAKFENHDAFLPKSLKMICISPMFKEQTLIVPSNATGIEIVKELRFKQFKMESVF